MILGGGRIGEMVARNMEKQAESVKLIDIKPERCEELSEILNKTLVINGDGRNSDLLIEEGIKEADAFVAAPKWLDRDKNTLTGKVVAMPTKADIDFDIAVHLIVELYSK